MNVSASNKTNDKPQRTVHFLLDTSNSKLCKHKKLQKGITKPHQMICSGIFHLLPIITSIKVQLSLFNMRINYNTFNDK